MHYELPPLPYEYDALKPAIDSLTMRIHHENHHGAYVQKLNDAVQGLDVPEDPRTLVENLDAVPIEVRDAVRNNGGGHVNHTLFWETMCPPDKPSKPTDELLDAIDASFGSLQKLRTQFVDAALGRFGSGWAWLCVHDEGGLFVSSTPNQDSPLMRGYVEQPGTPILGLDVWEHAYYLSYQNRRPDYIEAWWTLINWEQVSAHYRAAQPASWAHAS